MVVLFILILQLIDSCLMSKLRFDQKRFLLIVICIYLCYSEFSEKENYQNSFKINHIF